MIVIDLKYLLVGLFAFCLSVIGLVVLTARRYHRPQLQKDLWAIIEQAPFGYLVLNPSQIYEQANACARHLLNLPSSTGPLPDTDWATAITEDWQIAKQECSPVEHSRLICLGPNQFIQWSIFAINHFGLIFIFDVSTQQQGKRTYQLLLSGLSHELRTPIATILTQAEVLGLTDIADPVKVQSLKLLKQETQRMSRLVNQMLVLGRLETEATLEHRPLDLSALVQDTIVQIQAETEPQHREISLKADLPLPPIMGDVDQLRRVFFNLLDNALKYTPNGSQITILLQKQALGLACCIADNGPGIPVEHLPHLTHPFYRAAPQEIEGSGLGLAIVAEILHHHHSRLDIESQTDGDQTGTRIQFILPFLS